MIDRNHSSKKMALSLNRNFLQQTNMITVCKLFVGDMKYSDGQESWRTVLINTELPVLGWLLLVIYVQLVSCLCYYEGFKDSC
jgi:hypothetical protein